MEVSVWVPVLVAAIAAIPVLLSVRASRASTKAETSVKETELAVSGLATLVRELRAEREDCRQELMRVRERLALVELELGIRDGKERKRARG